MTNSELIFYGGILMCSIYLIYIITMQVSKINSRKNAINEAQEEYDLAKNDQVRTKNSLIDSITKIYGKENAEKVNAGTIWTGMPIHLLLVALGKANEIKENTYKGTTSEKWYYGEYQTRLGTYKYKFEITLENDEVVGWKDLA